MQQQQSAPGLINRLMAHILTETIEVHRLNESFATSRQRRTNLEEICRFGFGNKTRSEPDLTTQALARDNWLPPGSHPCSQEQLLHVFSHVPPP